MKAQEIVIGNLYIAKVSGARTILKVEEITDTGGYMGRPSRRVYRCTNMRTKRTIEVRSAARFRYKVPKVYDKVAQLFEIHHIPLDRIPTEYQEL